MGLFPQTCRFAFGLDHHFYLNRGQLYPVDPLLSKIPMAAAYTVFVGIGTVGTYLTGIVLGESFSAAQMFFLALLLAGILGMKLFTKESKSQPGGEK